MTKKLPTFPEPPSVRTVSGETLQIDGLSIDVSQSDLPYAPPIAGQPKLASTQDVVIHGDVVTINEPISNPGRKVNIFARQLIFGKGASIDVSGADGTPGYAAGEPAMQTDETPGAAGTDGATGGTGGIGGSITLWASRLSGGDQANVIVDIGAALTQACDRTWKNFASSSLPMPDLKIKNGVLQEVRVLGLDQVKPGFQIDLSRRELVIEPVGSGLRIEFVLLRSKFVLPNITLTGGLRFPITLGDTALGEPVGDLGLTSSWVATDEKGEPIPSFFNSFVADVSKPLTASFLEVARVALTLGLQNVSTPGQLLTSAGGKGGRAQDGHGGVKGVRGKDGKHLDINHPIVQLLPGVPPYFPPEIDGTSGGKGGNGGNPGSPGSGGPAGSIDLVILDPATVIGVDAGGGPGGDAAAGGAPGQGGPGGNAGSYYLQRAGMNVAEQMDADGGRQGADGDAPPEPGRLGVSGAADVVRSNGAKLTGTSITKASFDDLVPAVSTRQVQMLRRAAAADYLNATSKAQYELATARFEFLENLTRPFTRPNCPTASGVNDQERAVLASLNAVAAVERTRLAKGFDNYGHLPNWVPILRLEYLQSRTQQVLDLGHIVETEQTTYENRQASGAERIAALDRTRAKVLADVQNLEDERDALSNEIRAASNSIDDLLNQINSARSTIDEDTELFNTELRESIREESKCSFTQVLEAISSIFEIAEGVEGGLIKAGYSVPKGINGLVEPFEKEVERFEQADATIESIASTYRSIEGVLTEAHPDAAKVTVEMADFDRMLTDYFHKIGAAKELDIAVHRLFNLVQTRNQSLYAYNALYLSRAKLDARIAADQAELEQIAALRAQSSAPDLPAYVLFMQSMRDQIALDLVELIYREHRAYAYWSATEPSFSLPDFSLASLASTHERLSRDVDIFKTATGGPFEPFTQEVTISRADYEVAFSVLPETKQLQFDLAPGLTGFGHMAQVVVTDFAVELPGMEPDTGTLELSFRHNGNATVVAADGTEHSYTHQTRSTPYQFDYANPANKAGGVIGSAEQGFAGLSPFASWTLDFSAAENHWLDLSSISTITLKLRGSFIART